MNDRLHGLARIKKAWHSATSAKGSLTLILKFVKKLRFFYSENTINKISWEWQSMLRKVSFFIFVAFCAGGLYSSYKSVALLTPKKPRPVMQAHSSVLKPISSQLTGQWQQESTPSLSSDLLEINITSSGLQLNYFGVENTMDAHVLYSAVQAESIKWAQGEIEFTIPTRNLYEQRPNTLLDINQQTPASSTHTQWFMKGKLEDGQLLLNCTTTDGPCPTAQLIFVKKPA